MPAAVAVALLPTRMRTAQAGLEAEVGDDGVADEAGTVTLPAVDADVA